MTFATLWVNGYSHIAVFYQSPLSLYQFMQVGAHVVRSEHCMPLAVSYLRKIIVLFFIDLAVGLSRSYLRKHRNKTLNFLFMSFGMGIKKPYRFLKCLNSDFG